MPLSTMPKTRTLTPWASCSTFFRCSLRLLAMKVTTMMPSTRCAMIIASVTGRAGGASMTTRWSLDSSAIRSRIRSEPTTSLGLCGMRPAGSTSRPAVSVSTSASSSGTAPESTWVRPMPVSMSNSEATIGRRRSPSMSTTLPPRRASARASSADTVDLPSAGWGLVTTTERGEVSGSANIRLVRRCRSDSPTAPRRRSSECSRERRSRDFGMVPIRPMSVRPVMSSGRRILVSRRRRSMTTP